MPNNESGLRIEIDTEQARRNVERLGRSLRLLEEEGENAARGFEDLGDESENAAPQLSKLSLLLGKARAALGQIPHYASAVAASFGNMGTMIGSVVTSAISKLTAIASAVKEKIGAMIGTISGAVSRISSNFSALFSSLWGGLTSLVSGVTSQLRNLAQGVSGALGGLFTGIGPQLSALASSFIGTFSGLGSRIISIFSGLGTGIVSALGGVWSTLTSLSSSVWGVFRNMASGIGSSLSGLFSGIQGQMTGLVSSIVSGIGPFLNGIRERLTSLVSGIGGFVGNIGERFRSMFGSIRGGLGNLMPSFGSLRGVLLGVAGAAGLAAGSLGALAGGLMIATSKAAEADYNMMILANRANISAENFQILTKASDAYGVSQDQLGSIMADVQEKLGEFTASEGGGAADFFDALRNNTKLTDDQIRSFGKTLQGRDGVEAVQMLKDKMDDLSLSAQEQRFVMESLASDLGNLLPLFEDGGKSLEEYGNELREAGVIKTQEAIDANVMFASQQKALQDRFQGLKNQLVSAVMPTLSSLMDHFAQGVSNGLAFDSILQGIGFTAKVLGSTIVALSGIIRGVITLIRGFVYQAQNIGETAAAVVSADGFVNKSKALLNGFKSAGSNVGKTFKELGGDVKTTAQSMYDVYTNAKGTTDTLSKFYAAQTKIRPSGGGGVKTNTKQADDAKKAADKAGRDAEAAAKKAAATREKELREQQKAADDLARLRAEIEVEYMNDSQKRTHEHEKALSDIRKAYAGTQRDYFTAQENARFTAQEALIKAQNEADLFEFKKTEQQKLKDKAAIDRLKLTASQEFSDDEKAIRMKSIDEQLAYDLKKYEETQDEKLKKARESWAKAGDEAKYYLDTINMTDSQRRFFDQGLDNGDRLASLKADYDDYVKTLNETQSGESLNSELRKAQEEFERNKVELARMSAEEIKAINQELLENQITTWTSTFGALTDLVKGYAGESSKAYQGMLIVQKAADLTSVMMSSKVAIAKAWGSAPFPANLGAVASAAAETGLITAALKAITPNLAGMAHNGIDSIPREGTWLLDGGERVLNPQQNKDFTSYLQDRDAEKSKGNQGGYGSLRINNILDPQLVGNYMNSPSGERSIMNTIGGNVTELREMLGV